MELYCCSAAERQRGKSTVARCQWLGTVVLVIFTTTLNAWCTGKTSLLPVMSLFVCRAWMDWHGSQVHKKTISLFSLNLDAKLKSTYFFVCFTNRCPFLTLCVAVSGLLGLPSSKQQDMNNRITPHVAYRIQVLTRRLHYRLHLH